MTGFIKVLSSLKLTVFCLLLLAVLVFWGTLYQVEHGLYAAQQRFYYSWIFWLDGMVPFPGAQLVLSLLFINLLLAMLFHMHFGLRFIGIALIHFGLLLMLAGGWVTHRFGEESFLALREGEAYNLSLSYREWEVSIWRGTASARDVVAVDTGPLSEGRRIDFPEMGFSLTVEEYHQNVRAFRSEDETAAPERLNASGIHFLRAAKLDREPENNIPGGIFTATGPEGHTVPLLLYGEDTGPVKLAWGDEPIFIQLRRKRIPLPVVIQLIDFKKEFHPNTETPKSFSSKINLFLKDPDLQREVLIEMNQPFRYRGYTFYQQSYAVSESGAETSQFAVTRNAGRLIPYWATGIIFVGLAVHFLLVLSVKRRK